MPLGNRTRHVHCLDVSGDRYVLLNLDTRVSVHQEAPVSLVDFLTLAWDHGQHLEGPPMTLVTDHGVDCTSEALKDFLNKWGVEHRFLEVGRRNPAESVGRMARTAP